MTDTFWGERERERKIERTRQIQHSHSDDGLGAFVYYNVVKGYYYTYNVTHNSFTTAQTCVFARLQNTHTKEMLSITIQQQQQQQQY
jgi:hypothetical protein